MANAIALAIECQNFQWLEVSNLRKLPYSKADLKIIDQLETGIRQT